MSEEAAQAAADRAVAKALASQEAAAAEAAPLTTEPTMEVPAAALAEPAAPSAVSDQVDFAMPNFVGMNLQVTQDKVQALGIFVSVSHDLLGARNQLIDSNWQVCDQTPAAGTAIKGSAADYEGKIDFGAVKLTESCP